MNNRFLFGGDVSSLNSLELLGAKFYDEKGLQKELFTLLKDASFDAVRLRLWVNPLANDGQPYGGGDNDIFTTLKLAKRAKEKGFNIILDLHYSDFWADPGKQFIPKAWSHLSFEQLVKKVYEYTAEVLELFKLHDLPLSHIQVGNEITNGMLWPLGKLYEGTSLIPGSHQALAALLNSGIKACRHISPKSKIIIHLDRGGDKKMYQSYFDAMFPLLNPIDVIGLSYYPYWHGSLIDLEANIINLKKRYDKEIMIMETSYCFSGKTTTHPFVVSYKKTPLKKGNPPYTIKGQQTFLQKLLKLALRLKISGVIYWEPAWILVNKDTFATKTGLIYIQETKNEGNEWANQALFDFNGVALPALYTYKKIKGEKI